jgi:uncharacterized protein YbjT (DUF2867 family)
MKVAVVGGTGFIGRHLVEALAARGHAVVGYPPAALRGCQAVVNLAGIKRDRGPATTW